VSLPGWLDAILPGETGLAWEQVAPLLPPEAYLGGGTAIAVHLRHRQSRDLDFFYHEPIDLDELQERLRSRGPFAVTLQAAGTLNGLLGTTRLQFLQVGLERPERRLEPTTLVAGLPVAGLGDLLAMELNAIAGRARLRDYYDLMAIEQQAGRSVEEGLSLYIARYQPEHPDSAITPILLGLGYLDDVADDPFLPAERDTITRYWQKRQPAIITAIDRHGITSTNQLGRWHCGCRSDARPVQTSGDDGKSPDASPSSTGQKNWSPGCVRKWHSRKASGVPCSRGPSAVGAEKPEQRSDCCDAQAGARGECFVIDHHWAAFQPPEKRRHSDPGPFAAEGGVVLPVWAFDDEAVARREVREDPVVLGVRPVGATTDLRRQ
jgi:hypothetical protein